MEIRHFLQLSSCSKKELYDIINHAIATKNSSRQDTPAAGKTLALIFEKPSTRTRISFEAGFAQLGGYPLFLAADSLQLGRGEPVSDTARVISSMVDMIMVRTFAHDKLLEMSENSSVAVINGLTDSHHPCQILADIMTFIEYKKKIEGSTVAFIGDCSNNVCNSFIEAAKIFDFRLQLACPEKFRPQSINDHVRIYTDPCEAVAGSDLVVTDVWASMGDEHEQQQRIQEFAGYQVTSDLLNLGNDPMFLHCLPAHRGEEIDHTVIMDSRSKVWQASENRLHVQKSLMEFLLDVNK